MEDLWDMPHSLAGICNGANTLLFMCDPGMATCREGAVYFDSRTDEIWAHEVQPACLFIGRPQDVRQIVLTLDLDVPVYIDADREVYENLLDQRILPAMILLDGNGNVIKTIYGGGESLDSNLRIILGEPEDGGHWRLILSLVAAAVVGIILIVLD